MLFIPILYKCLPGTCVHFKDCFLLGRQDKRLINCAWVRPKLVTLCAFVNHDPSLGRVLEWGGGDY